MTMHEIAERLVVDELERVEKNLAVAHGNLKRAIESVRQAEDLVVIYQTAKDELEDSLLVLRSDERTELG